MIHLSPIRQINQEGFTLIELITVLMVVGIIAVFAGVFLVRAISGYMFGKNNADMALKTQTALERITIELNYIDNVTSLTVNSDINYSCNTTQAPQLTGNRAVKFSSGNLYLRKNGTDYLLLENISNPSLSAPAPSDYDGDGESDIQYITLGFDKAVNNITKTYSIRVRPRNLVNYP